MNAVIVIIHCHVYVGERESEGMGVKVGASDGIDDIDGANDGSGWLEVKTMRLLHIQINFLWQVVPPSR